MPQSSVMHIVTKITVFLFFSTFTGSPVYADTSSWTGKYKSFENVRFVKNYDGDSITFDIPETPAIVGKNIVIRLRGIDTPELKKKSCLDAIKIAQQAKEMVHSLLKNAKVINLHRIERGKYFRILADVEFDGQDLATVLLNNKLAVQYSGGRKEYDWCTHERPNISVKHSSGGVLPPKVSGVYVWPPPPVQKQDTSEYKKNDQK
ncbi:MAG: thermonuclease family protein [Thermodesulfobacteriota bacterium]|nr:thermonuclease family protein [Thermodesulfobacteriota bacterium]